MENPKLSNRRIKVLFVIGALTTGGTERQMIGILNQLDRQKFQPFLFTFYSHGELVDQIPEDVTHYCDQRQNSKQPRRWLPGGIQSHLTASLSAYCQHQQIDVVYDRTFHVSLVTGAACRISKTPYLNTIVANPFQAFYATAGIFGRIKYWRLRKIYRHAAAVLCVSDGIVDAAAKFYRLPNSTFVSCPNFIDQQRLTQIDLAARQRQSPAEADLCQHDQRQTAADTNCLKVIAVGRLHHDKGLDVLLQSVQYLVHQQQLNIQLTLVGDGPERHNLEAITVDFSIQSHVQFVGWVANPAPWVARSDLFVLSSRSEGMPNSLLEAMFLGTPAIATDCPFGPAEITEGGTLASLIPIEDATSLSNAIVEFVQNPTAWTERAVRAGPILRAKYAAQAGIQRLESCLSEAAVKQKPQ